MSQTISDQDRPAGSEVIDETQVVTGRRLVNKEEEFVLTNQAPSKPKLEAEGDNPKLCLICGDDIEDGETTIFLEALQGDTHVSCLPSPPSEEKDPAAPQEKLKEWEIVLQARASEDGYSLRVDRLPNYAMDQRSDTQAVTEYCTKLRPVTLDYLEIIRKRFGAGTYLFRMFGPQGLVKGGMWSETVLEEKTPAEEPSPAANLKTPVQISFREQMEELAATNRAVREALGIPVPGKALTETPAPPGNALDELNSFATKVTTVLEVADKLRPAPATTGGDGDRSVVRDVLEVSRELGVGEVVREFVRPLAGFAGSMMAQAMRDKQMDARRKAAEAMRDGGGQPAEGRSQTADIPRGTIGPRPVSENINSYPQPHIRPTNVSRETNMPPPLNAEPLEPEIVEFLRGIVQEMMSGADASESARDVTIDNAIGRCVLAIQFKGPDVIPFIEEIIAKPGYEMLGWLGDVNIEWKLLRSTTDAGDYINWCEDFRAGMRDTLAEDRAGDETREVRGVSRETQSPSPGESESLNSSVGMPTTEVSGETKPGKSKKTQK